MEHLTLSYATLACPGGYCFATFGVTTALDGASFSSPDDQYTGICPSCREKICILCQQPAHHLATRSGDITIRGGDPCISPTNRFAPSAAFQAKWRRYDQRNMEFARIEYRRVIANDTIESVEDNLEERGRRRWTKIVEALVNDEKLAPLELVDDLKSPRERELEEPGRVKHIGALARERFEVEEMYLHLEVIG